MNLLRGKTHKKKESIRETTSAAGVGKGGKNLLGKIVEVSGRRFKVKELLGEGTV